MPGANLPKIPFNVAHYYDAKKTTNRHSQKTTFALLLATFGADRHHMRTSANPESS